MGSYLDKPKDIDQLVQESAERLLKKKESTEAFKQIMAGEALKSTFPLNTIDHHVQTEEEAAAENEERKQQREEKDIEQAEINEDQDIKNRARYNDGINLYE